MKRRVIHFIVLLLAPAAMAQTREAGSVQERQTLLREVQQDVSKLPEVKADSIDEVINIKTENNRLMVTTPIKPSESDIHIVSPAIQGIARMKWYRTPADESDKPYFHLLVEDLTHPGEYHAMTMISNVAGRVIISRDRESDTTAPSVQYIQDSVADETPVDVQMPVRLFVTVNFADEDKQPIKHEVEAPDFIQLRRQNEALVDEYLRPILRDYRQEANVFAIPAAIAWQVLGGDRQVDPEVDAKLKQIIPKLDSSNFRERQTAMNDLKALGSQASLVLSKMDRSSLSLQQSSTIDAFLAETAPLAGPDSSGLAQNKSFLLDVLFNQDAELVKLALKQLSSITGKPVALDASLHGDARNAAIAKLRGELIPTTRPG